MHHTKAVTIHTFARMKSKQQKMTLVTCYDYWSAQIINHTAIDAVLVGDSLAMVMHGHTTTLPATVEMMALHTRAVAQGLTHQFIISDMPFMSYRQDFAFTMRSVTTLMQSGAHAIKIEGCEGNTEMIQHIVSSGVPVMGHLGLTPQFYHGMGGFKVQGREDKQAKLIIEQAKALQEAGCFALVLECVPASLAQVITETLTIPLIGIGAGCDTDGQILVLHDLLGLNLNHKPKLAKSYLNGGTLIKDALNHYVNDVKQNIFPERKHCYRA